MKPVSPQQAYWVAMKEILLMGISPLQLEIQKQHLWEKLTSNLSTGEWAQFGYQMLVSLKMLEELVKLVGMANYE